MNTLLRRPVVVGTLLAVGALLLAAPRPDAAVRQLREAASAAEPTAPLVAAVALLAYLLAGWLLVTAALTLLSRVPGAGGLAAAAAVRRLAPAAVRQLLAAALGVAAVTGLAAGHAAADEGAGSPVQVASLDWPGSSPQLDLDWPEATATVAGPGLRPPAHVGPPLLAATTSTGEAADAVVVQPGDTLWGLAEQALAQHWESAPSSGAVAAAWPAWWTANREVVGEDPDLLLPGTALQPPVDHPAAAGSPPTPPAAGPQPDGSAAADAPPAAPDVS